MVGYRPWLGSGAASRRPETFAFLGFTHYCGWTRDGRFIVKHKMQSNRLPRKLTALRQEARRRMHTPLAEQHIWYSSVLRGHYGYFGLPHNWRSLNALGPNNASWRGIRVATGLSHS